MLRGGWQYYVALHGGRFTDLVPIDQGGYGRVYSAIDRETGERIALKELSRTTPSSLAHFKQELRALHDLEHPNLVGMRELFEQEGRWFITMELVAGCDLRSYVCHSNEGAGFDEQRLRNGLSQLAEGLSVLHDAGLIHRDLKPENIRVTPEERVVLLDFGLVEYAALDGDTDVALGTAAYMAPEQATGQRATVPMDWYAFGVVLFELLTGQLPISGSPAHMMVAKQMQVPVLPSQLNPAVPRDLDHLCASLLETDPRRRPGGLTVLRALSRRRSIPARSNATMAPPIQAPFAGRVGELAQLTSALQRTRTGRMQLALLQGESGIGKTALALELVHRALLSRPDTLVLRGRCYEREVVPYKAFDGVVDSLSRYLSSLDDGECEALLPDCAGVLSRLFPVIGGVEAVARAHVVAVADPVALRRQAFEALALLLGNVASTRPLIIVVDDVHWADVESFQLMRAVMTSSTGLLAVFTCRPDLELRPALRPFLHELRTHPEFLGVTIGGLEASEAQSLAAQLLGNQGSSARAERVAEESNGHPLFIAELVRHAQHARRGQSATLDEALRQRIGRLALPSRRIMETVALHGRSCSLRLLADVLRAPIEDVRRHSAALRSAHLLRSGSDGRLQCFHDRLRAAALSGLQPTQARELHVGLARALTAHGEVDAADVGQHWELAGHAERAFHCFSSAALEALEALAFDRAVRLCERCLLVDSPTIDAVSVQATRVTYADALSLSGRSAAAAQAYEIALVGAEGAEVVRLRILAAQHMLLGAEVELGFQAAESLLRQLGSPMPAAGVHALASLAWNRTRLRLRALRPSASGELSKSTTDELEALWRLLQPICWYDMLRGSALTTRYVRLALDSDNPLHVARALAQEATFRAMTDPHDKAAYHDLLEQSAEIACRIDDPETTAWVLLCRGQILSLRMELRGASVALAQAERLLCERCPAAPWLLTLCRVLLLSCQFGSGSCEPVLNNGEQWLDIASERGDRFARAALAGAGSCALRHLMRDEPEAAQHELSEAMKPMPRRPFGPGQLGELMTQFLITAYVDGSALQALLDEHSSELSWALVFKTAYGRDIVVAWRGWAAIAGAVHAARTGGRVSVAQVHRYAGQLSASRSPAWRRAAAALRSQASLVQGDRESALRYASEANEGFGDGEGAPNGVATHYLAARLSERERGSGPAEAIIARLREQGWRQPERWLRAVAPALWLVP